MENAITIISLLTGLTSLIGGVILWYKSAITKQYAAERDFKHLQRNLEQISGVLTDVCETVDRLEDGRNRLQEQVVQISLLQQSTKDAFIEQKAFIAGISNRIEWIAALLQGERSGGWQRRE